MESWLLWIEGFYQAHPAVAGLLGLIVAFLSLLAGAMGTYFTWRSARRSLRSDGVDERARLTKEQRSRLLDRVLAERVEPRLRQGLREAIRVDLGLTEAPGAVPARLKVYRERESGPPEERPVKGPIWRIFEQTAGGRLLILGEPGTGKTNLLLELARQLVADAKADESLPIPIVFSLPRWTLGRKTRTLAEWMVDDLAAEYGLSRAAAKLLVEEDGILPLLDGLDEVAEERRRACVDAIHAYEAGRSVGRLAVCCRIQEYEDLPDLKLAAAVRVEKLTREDVEREISKPKMEYVRRALDADPELWEVVESPLWLHVLFGAAQESSPTGGVEQEPRQRLYSRYVEYALGRDSSEGSRRRSSRDRVLRRLGWLAANLKRTNQVYFALEDLRLNWLNPWTRLVGMAVVVALAGLVFGSTTFILLYAEVYLTDPVRMSQSPWWVFPALAALAGLLTGIAAIFPFFLLRSIGIGKRIELRTVERTTLTAPGINDLYTVVRWSAIATSLGWFLLWIVVLGRAGPEALIEASRTAKLEYYWIEIGLATFIPPLALGLAVGLVVLILRMLRSAPRVARQIPNQGTKDSAISALVWTAGAVCSVLLVICSVPSPVDVAQEEIGPGLRGLATRRTVLTLFHFIGVLPVLIPAAGSVGLLKGGLFAIQHYTVRLFLFLHGYAPLRYVRFLNEATERLFLIRQGGSYQFFHVTFRDYLADRYERGDLA